MEYNSKWTSNMTLLQIVRSSNMSLISEFSTFGKEIRAEILHIFGETELNNPKLLYFLFILD